MRMFYVFHVSANPLNPQRLTLLGEGVGFNEDRAPSQVVVNWVRGARSDGGIGVYSSITQALEVARLRWFRQGEPSEAFQAIWVGSELESLHDAWRRSEEAMQRLFPQKEG